MVPEGRDYYSVFWDRPYCSGCGARFDVLHFGLASSDRGPPFSAEMAARGSVGPQLLEFARKHEKCPDRTPSITVSQTGITTIDYRSIDRK